MADEIADRYIHGPVEDITSKLAAEPAMRFHLLSQLPQADSKLEGQLVNSLLVLILATLKPIHTFKKQSTQC